MARPSTGRTERFELRVEPEWLKVVDRLRKQEEDLPTRREFVHRLVLRMEQQAQAGAA